MFLAYEDVTKMVSLERPLKCSCCPHLQQLLKNPVSSLRDYNVPYEKNIMGR
jgi:hypothetical protein